MKRSSVGYLAALAFSLAACSVPTPTSIEGAQAASKIFKDGTFASVFQCRFSIDRAILREYPSTEATVYFRQPDDRIEQWFVKNPVVRTTLVRDEKGRSTDKEWFIAVLGEDIIYFLNNKDVKAIEECSPNSKHVVRISNDESGKFPKILKKPLDGKGYEDVGKISIRRRYPGERK